MKKFSLIVGTLLVLALAGPAAALDIHFCIDGPDNCYCDGVYVTNTLTGVGGDKVFHGTQTGCAADVVAGTKAINRVSRTWKYTLSLPLWDVITVVRKSGTWTHYNMDGTVQNSGLWYFGPPPAGTVMGAPASFSAQ